MHVVVHGDAEVRVVHDLGRSRLLVGESSVLSMER